MQDRKYIFHRHPYKDMHDVMNDVFVEYRVKLYEQELEH